MFIYKKVYMKVIANSTNGTMIYTKVNVVIEQGGVVEGFATNELWKGFYQPVFTREQIENVIRHYDPNNRIILWDENRNGYWVGFYLDEPIGFYVNNFKDNEINQLLKKFDITFVKGKDIIVEGIKYTVFSITDGWCWDLYKATADEVITSIELYYSNIGKLKELCNQQQQVYEENGVCGNDMIYFKSSHDVKIINPFKSECTRFNVDPLEYYGKNFILSIPNFLKPIINLKNI